MLLGNQSCLQLVLSRGQLRVHSGELISGSSKRNVTQKNKICHWESVSTLSVSGKVTDGI